LGARGFAEYSDRNVFNYGGKGSARAELSLERPKVTLQYLHPHVFTRDTKLVASLFDEFQRDNPSFEVERRGGRLAVHHTFDPTLSLSVGYLFQQVDPSDVNKAAQISPYDTDVLNLGGLDTQVLWDFRDDIIQPRKGGVNQLYLRMTSNTLGAEAEFFEAQAQSNWYWRVLGDMVVACALSGKIIEPANGSKQVPIYARYFLGGDNTVRGFKKYEIGPSVLNEEGDAVRVGGNRLVRGNAEVRFPIYGSFGGVLFYDAGANWINEDGFNSGYIREGAGVGLRVATPIGPLRLDYGWKLDREDGESAGEFYFTIGSAF
jgi:outer membrane protein insertion porin family